MSAYAKKEIMWFLTFLAFLNVFNSILMWALYGSSFEFEPYVIGQFTGSIQVAQYFWTSITVAFALLGCTAVMVLRNLDRIEALSFIKSHLANDKEFLERELWVNRNSIESIKIELLEKMEVQKRFNENFFETFNASLQNVQKEMLNHIKEPEKTFQRVSNEEFLAIETRINDVGGKLSSALKKQEEIVKKVGKLNKNIEKAKVDLTSMRKGLKMVESALILPEPKMTAESSPKELKGIGPCITKELGAIGITNVGGFLTADFAVIGEKTRLTQEKAERLQGIVQLLMVPDIDEIDIELLEKVGVTNRKELAAQDPFELNIRLSEVAKTYIKGKKRLKYKKPSLEKAVSWIQIAKL